MFEALQKLVVLQDRDTRRLEIEADLDTIPASEKKAKAQLLTDQQAVEALKTKLQENALATKTLQLDAQTRRTSIERLRQQQFETKKNEEFAALGKEVERYTEQVDELETKELELMEAADSLQSELEAAYKGLLQTQARVDEVLKDLVTRRKSLEESKTEVTAELDALRGKFDDSSLLGLYDRLLKSKGGLAMAAVVGDKCQGCHMKLVKSTLSKLRADKEIAQCENCNRLLYEV